MWAVSEALICFLIDDCSEMFFGAMGVSFGFLAFISCAKVTVLQIFFRLELKGFDFFLVAPKALKLRSGKKYMSFDIDLFSKKRRSIQEVVDEESFFFLFGSGFSLLLLKSNGIRRRGSRSLMTAPLILLEGTSAKDAFDDGD